MTKGDSNAKTPRWVCSECGMGSTRKGAVNRHIETFHPGDAVPVSFMEYVTGVQDGTYAKPTYAFQTTKAGAKKKNREFARRHGIVISLSQVTNNDDWLTRADRFIGDVIAGYVETDALRIARARYLGEDHDLREIIVSNHDPSIPKVRGFTGFVCPKCLGLCISELLQDAGAIRLRVREHKCKRKHWIDVPEQFRTNQFARKQLIDELHNDELFQLMSCLISQIEKQTGRHATIFFDPIRPKETEFVASPILLDYSTFDPTSKWRMQILEKLKDGQLPDWSEILYFFRLFGMSTFVTVKTGNTSGLWRSYNMGITFE